MITKKYPMASNTIEVVRFAFIDVEASGFGSASYPIEIGCVFPDGVGYCSLIKPEPDWLHWDDSAEKVHGIPREMLFLRGHAPHNIAMELNEKLSGKRAVTDAWYHDYNWIQRLFDAADLVPHFELMDLRSLLDDEKVARWDAIKAGVQAELNLQRHRASHDARILQMTYQRLMAI
jgi:DNA polymerase III epsilon subunit-like protein